MVNISIVRATVADTTFISQAYQAPEITNSVAKWPNVKDYIKKCIAVFQKQERHVLHPHPFVTGQPVVYPIDDLFLLKKGDATIGVLWLRDYNDLRLLEREWFGELIFFWIRPEYRGQKTWPQIAPLVKTWALQAKKSHLMGRCLKGTSNYR